MVDFGLSGSAIHRCSLHQPRRGQVELARKGYNPNPPELVVEVISNENNAAELRDLRRNITNYLSEKSVVWVVYPIAQIVLNCPVFNWQ